MRHRLGNEIDFYGIKQNKLSEAIALKVENIFVWFTGKPQTAFVKKR